ncbi:FAD/NAD(P)-binding domain-containing protein [Penicillium alfredii]|uniref:FAD/NAD(P)-binding domain-containing protein n=1 Tax=Penicillium alfredii TaxID=1506179 RepID=A0A9W9F2H6_9EURO|nr:FAD/NAD(P)-binding domain-containing protein [Penicillium alfredii]KAJ5092453.1 FAD/NAD(P)-binding domain-containing protein [Penicillium alfredii]
MFAPKWGGLLKDADYGAFGSYYFDPSAAGDALRFIAEDTMRMGVRYCLGEVRRILLRDEGVAGVKTPVLARMEDELGIFEGERIQSQVTAAGVSVAHLQSSC